MIYMATWTWLLDANMLASNSQVPSYVRVHVPALFACSASLQIPQYHKQLFTILTRPDLGCAANFGPHVPNDRVLV